MERVAAYKAVPTHSVYFLDSDGRLIDEPRRVAHGRSVTPPEYTAPEGRIFLNWSRDTSVVNEDVYCVALTKAQPPEDVLPNRCRVHVIDLRQSAGSSLSYGCLLPLGRWNVGETVNRDDLACLRLRNLQKLSPFSMQVSCDTVLTLTDNGVRAFESSSMRPIDRLKLVVALPTDYGSAQETPYVMQKGA